MPFNAGQRVPRTRSVTTALMASSPARLYSLLRSSKISTNLAGNQPKESSESERDGIKMREGVISLFPLFCWRNNRKYYKISIYHDTNYRTYTCSCTNAYSKYQEGKHPVTDNSFIHIICYDTNYLKFFIY